MRLRRLFLEVLVVTLPAAVASGCGARVEAEGSSAGGGGSPTSSWGSGASDDPSLGDEAGTFAPPPPAADAGGAVDTTAPDTSASCSTPDAYIVLDRNDDGGCSHGSSMRYQELWPCMPEVDSGYASPSSSAECAALCSRAGLPDAGYPCSCWASDSCNFTRSAEGIVATCSRNYTCGAGGRRPDGFAPSAIAERNVLASFHASIAELEAVSVDAFHILRAELAAHGAPRPLRLRCSRAARDEVRHARKMRKLARRFGASSREVPRVPRGATRSLEAIAIENAVEGCVRETWAALVAEHQARAAIDPSIRTTMRMIAADETRHAELSWDVARFLDRKLTQVARDRVRAARHAAVAQLRAEIARGTEATLVTRAGLPPRDQALAVFDALAPKLWS